MSASTLNTLLTDINTNVASSLAYKDAVFYTQAELQTKDEKTFPLINNGDRSGNKISLNDKHSLQSYHRVISSETNSDYNGGKGKYPYIIRTYTIRNVWLGSLRRLPGQVYESTDDIKNDVFSAFPVILTNKEIVKVNSENIDKQAILDEEFAGYDTKHLTLELVIFYIEYEIRQKVKCN